MKPTDPLRKQIQALPSYLGGKRKLLSWISTSLAEICPPSAWSNKTFIDLFRGGGAVSLWAKAQGFKTVISNDISVRSQLISDAFLTNHRIQLSTADTLWLTQPLPEQTGWIETCYSPSVFSTRHARILDQGFFWAEQHGDPVKRALLKILMWHLAHEFVAFPTSLGTSNRPFAEALDGLRDWGSINPKRFTDGSVQRLCRPGWQRLSEKRRVINRGVLGGSPVQAYQQDALTLLPQIQGDILYLDPPYPGTLSYERENSVLDSLLTGDPHPPKVPTSAFSHSTDPLNDLLEQAQHIPIWVLSYGNKTCTLEELIAQVERHANGRMVKGFSRYYRHLTHVSQNKDNQEFLVLAYPPQEISICR